MDFMQRRAFSKKVVLPRKAKGALPLRSEMATEGGREKTQSKAKYPGNCIEAFKKLPPTEQARIKAFTFSYGGKPDETIEWSILGDTEHIVNCPMEEEQKRREEKEREAREEEEEEEEFDMDMDMDMEEGGVSSPFTVDIPWDAEPANVDYSDIF